MPFIPLFNPQVVSPGHIKRFSGVYGLPNTVIKKSDSAGRNQSDKYCNDQFDLNSDRNGQIYLREGFVKLGAGQSSTIQSIFEVRLSGVIQYGIIDESGLTLYDIPWIVNPNIPLPPVNVDEDDIISPFPASFERKPWKKPEPKPESDAPPADPSVPPAAQSCEDHHTHITSPSVLNFTMAKGGTLPANQTWFWQVKGWWPTIAHYGTYVTRPAWYTNWEGSYAYWLAKECEAVLQRAVVVKIKTEAQSLAVGVHTWNDGIAFTDGDSHSCTINLTITEAIMSVTSAISLQVMQDGTTGNWETLTISNSTAGTTLNWTASIVSDTSGKLELSAASGSCVGIASSQITFTLSSIPAVGTYSAVVRITGDGSPASIDCAVTLDAEEEYASDIKCSVEGQIYRGLNAEHDTAIYTGARDWIYTHYTGCSARLKFLSADPGVGSVWSGNGWYIGSKAAGANPWLYQKATSVAFSSGGYPVISGRSVVAGDPTYGGIYVDLYTGPNVWNRPSAIPTVANHNITYVGFWLGAAKSGSTKWNAGSNIANPFAVGAGIFNLRVCYVSADVQPTGISEGFNPFQWANWSGHGWYKIVRLNNDEIPNRSPYGLWTKFDSSDMAAVIQSGTCPSSNEYYLDTPPGTDYITFTW